MREVLDLAKEIKALLKSGSSEYKPFKDQTLAMIFTKPSTRTRVSFESGFFRLGGHALCLGEEVGIGKREATKDVSRVLASMNEMLVREAAPPAAPCHAASMNEMPGERCSPTRCAMPRCRGHAAWTSAPGMVRLSC